MSLTGSSVLGLGGGCLGIPILAPTALEREKSSDWPMGWSRLLVWLAPRSRRRQVESYDHAQHWDEGGEVAAVIASSRRRRRPAHQARHVHQHHPLGPPPPSSPLSTVQSIPIADPAAAKGGMMGGDVQRRSGSRREQADGWVVVVQAAHSLSRTNRATCSSHYHLVEKTGT